MMAHCQMCGGTGNHGGFQCGVCGGTGTRKHRQYLRGISSPVGAYILTVETVLILLEAPVILNSREEWSTPFGQDVDLSRSSSMASGDACRNRVFFLSDGFQF